MKQIVITVRDDYRITRECSCGGDGDVIQIHGALQIQDTKPGSIVFYHNTKKMQVKEAV